MPDYRNCAKLGKAAMKEIHESQTTRPKIFFSPFLSKRSSAAIINTILGMTKFSEEIGFEPRILRYPRNSRGIFNHYLEFARSYSKAKLFLTLYPYFLHPTSNQFHPARNLSRTFDRHTLKLLRRMRASPGTVLYVTDLPIEQAFSGGDVGMVDEETYRTEKDVFDSFDVLCVFNSYLKRVVSQRYQIPEEKFVEFEMLDHFSDYTPSMVSRSKFDKWTIVYAGTYNKQYVGDWISDLPKCAAIRYLFTGSNWDWVLKLGRDDMAISGFISDRDFTRYLSENAHFGIIKTSSGSRSEYYNAGSSSKMGSYLAAGLPILVSSECTYISSLVSKYRVGLEYSSIDEIPSILDRLSPLDYELMRNRAHLLGHKVRSGYFFKRAIGLATAKLDSYTSERKKL